MAVQARGLFLWYAQFKLGIEHLLFKPLAF